VNVDGSRNAFVTHVALLLHWRLTSKVSKSGRAYSAGP